MVWLWVLLAWSCTRRIPEERPDIIFLTVDTLRVDHVGAYNPDSPATTPTMDRLAEQGLRFTNAYSPISVTGPAFCTLHTGLRPALGQPRQLHADVVSTLQPLRRILGQACLHQPLQPGRRQRRQLRHRRRLGSHDRADQ